MNPAECSRDTPCSRRVHGVTSVIGSAALLRWQGRLIFEVQSPDKWKLREGASPTIGVGCIGGGLEDGETPLQALRREALEEIGCGISLSSTSEPFFVAADGSVIPPSERLPAEGVSFFWGGYQREHRMDSCVAVFHGTATDAPSPLDLPAVLLAGRGQVYRLLDGELTVGDWLAGGGQVVSRAEIPREAVLEPVGTTAFLQRLRRLNAPLCRRCLWGSLPAD